VIEQTAQEWSAFCAAFAQYASHIDRLSAHHVNSQSLKDETKQVAQLYFRRVRPLLMQWPLDELVEPVSIALQTLLEQSEARSLTSSYKRNTKTIRKLIPKITSQLEIHGGNSAIAANTSPADQEIIDILNDLVPSAARSYQQAVTDLADPKRISFRGPALELRESLREVLNHLAPDALVTKAPNFKLETGRLKPTTRQKVRFIFKAREQSATESAAPEDAANTIDALIADMTRSVYDHGSLATHVSKGKRSVDQLKRYVDVIFHDLLEL
jgi:hypothetical protein